MTNLSQKKRKQMSNKVVLTGKDLTLEQVYAVVFEHVRATLAKEARSGIEASRALIERCVASDAAVYGVNTGFGRMASTRISRVEICELQTNLVRSHACGIGAPLSEAETRAMLLLRANALAKGCSGVRPVVVETLCALLDRGVHPIIPSQGSVGASGDLAPLAHLAEVVIGEGQAMYKGETMPGSDALRVAKIAPLRLEAKEGLALLNGTQGMQSLLALAVHDAETLVETADVAAALSLDALRGSPVPFADKIARVRPFAGHALTAGNLRRLNEGSAIRESHRSPSLDSRVQDPYCLRCTPQVHGAVRDALAHVKAILSVELNSATDNPLVFAETEEVLSGGNFHGQPLAMAADHLAVALATLAGISERRIEQMTNPQSSQLPAFLVSKAGLHSGFMILHVAAAALVGESKALATPHSVDSIPTSANQEDYVSMGMSAARRLKPMLENVRNVLAIELLAAAQGLDFLAPLRTGERAQRAQNLVRSASKFVEIDRSLSADIQAVSSLIASGRFREVLSASA
jgi:histidine ammonia-lyase